MKQGDKLIKWMGEKGAGKVLMQSTKPYNPPWWYLLENLHQRRN